jgi:hypothetical protein
MLLVLKRENFIKSKVSKLSIERISSQKSKVSKLSIMFVWLISNQPTVLFSQNKFHYFSLRTNFMKLSIMFVWLISNQQYFSPLITKRPPTTILSCSLFVWSHNKETTNNNPIMWSHNKETTNNNPIMFALGYQRAADSTFLSYSQNKPS